LAMIYLGEIWVHIFIQKNIQKGKTNYFQTKTAEL
jgi:hypothetical protein